MFKIAMTAAADSEQTTPTTHQDQTACNPGILKELKHEISELLTQPLR